MKSNQETKPRSKSNARKVLKDFCESTSLHGYSYLYSADSLILKVAWTFVILAATCLGVVFLGNQTREYLDGTILTTIETSSAPLDVSIYDFYRSNINLKLLCLIRCSILLIFLPNFRKLHGLL